MRWLNKDDNEIVQIIEVQCLVKLKSGKDSTITFCHPTNMAITTEGNIWGISNKVSFDVTDVRISEPQFSSTPEISYNIDFPELEDAPQEDKTWEISWD